MQRHEKSHEISGQIKNKLKYEMADEMVKKDMEVATWKAKANFLASKVRAVRVGRYRGMCNLQPLQLVVDQGIPCCLLFTVCRLSTSPRVWTDAQQPS